MRASVFALVGAAMLVVLVPASSSAQAPTVARPAGQAAGALPASVVIVGMPGLRWSDVTPDTTPYLWQMLDESALGQMSTRSARSHTCPADGWVQLGTGNRARYPVSDEQVDDQCQPVPAMSAGDDGSTHVDRWDAVVADNDLLTFNAVPGLLGQTLGDTLGVDRGCTAASGPGSGLAAADADGWVDHWTPEPIALTPNAVRECPLLVLGVDEPSAERRLGELAALDELVGNIDRMRPQGSLMMVLGVSDLADERPQLHVALAEGPGYSGGLLLSGSTRRAPFVQLSDVAPTVLDYLGVAIPDEMSYQPMRSVPANGVDDRVGWFRELSQQADVQGKLTPPFFGLLVLLQAVLYLGAFLILRRHPRERTRSRVLSFTHVVAVAAAAGPAATYLANILPWWLAGKPVPALLAAISLAGAVLTAIAFAGPWRRHPFGPAGAVTAATAIVLLIDVAAGAPLQLASLAGYSPIVAGRFVGFGNLAFAIFGTAALLGAAAGVSGRSPRTSGIVVAVVGVVAVVVDGAPSLGSDFGGVLALVPAFGTLGILATGRRMSWTRLAALFGAGVMVVSVIAFLDYLRPAANRSHLGRFVGSLISGDAAAIVQRKLEANLSLLTTSVLTLMVPLVLVFLAFLVRRPSGLLPWTFVRVPTLRSGLLAVLVLGVVGALVNDSGVAIPAMAATVAIPVAVAVVVRCMQLDDGDPTVSSAEPAGAGRGAAGSAPPG
ncbi:MAG: hypothetical protein LH645_01380 [Actinomycetia bacterium]|nr:hypothetical protein [Actinomycetes bacterium]